MKAAYVCADSGVPVFGAKGCSIHVQELIHAFLQTGVNISLFARELEGTPPPAMAQVTIHALPRYEGKEKHAREAADLAFNQQLSSILNREGPFDFIYERYSLWSFAAAEWATSIGIPTVVEVNSPLIDEQIEYRGLIHQSEAEQSAKRLFQAASYVVIVSQALKKYIKRFSVSRQKVHVIPNAVNPYRFPHGLAPAVPASAGTFTIGFLGSLKPWHGLLHLLEAFEILFRKDPNVRLLLIGDGPQRQSLTEWLKSRGLLSAAHFTGMVPPHDVPAFLASMDVGVAPYPPIDDHYFSPMKVFEYMAAGLPVVASAIGQLNEIISDGITGLLYPPGDIGLLAWALERLRNSPGMRASLGLAARSQVLRNHTWTRNAELILKLVARKKDDFPATAKGA